MNTNKELTVLIGDEEVGTLAETKDHRVAFAYSENWLKDGFSLNPFSLPLNKEVFLPKQFNHFEGLFGVFADSLPDGWGRLLVDRLLQSNHIEPASVNSLTRLAIVGDSGMGALEYKPQNDIQLEASQLTLDELAKECKEVLNSNNSNYLDELYRMGGSSGGARPKIFYQIDGEPWIVKFPSSSDRNDIGKQEFQYSLCAVKCGISMSETRLLPSEICDGFFATKRFDRRNGKKVHMVSVSALLETSHRIPNLDYNTLMQLTLKLTRSYEEVEKLFRLMCFNVYAHNRDDHSKNFSFLYQDNKWQLSPAYDLTYSSSVGGEHATTVNGNGSNPGLSEILEVAGKAKMDMRKAKIIAEEIKEIVSEELTF